MFWELKAIPNSPGATIISCFFDLIRRNVRSFYFIIFLEMWRGVSINDGPTKILFSQNKKYTCGSRSRITLFAFALSWLMSAEYCTVSALSRVVRMGIPSELTTTMPCTPLCDCSRLIVSSTSDCFGEEAISL